MRAIGVTVALGSQIGQEPGVGLIGVRFDERSAGFLCLAKAPDTYSLWRVVE
ncbi:MAG: hypothetical protein ACPGQM_08455 [Alphaproteobacteria bacterium]